MQVHVRLVASWRGLSRGEYRGVEESTSTRVEYIGLVVLGVRTSEAEINAEENCQVEGIRETIAVRVV